MSLATIKTAVARRLGVGSDANSQAWLRDVINRAAREVYNETDLPGSVCEQYFTYSNDENQAVFPHYVGHLRAIRRSSLRWPIEMDSLAPRYHKISWDSADQFKFRIRKVSPTFRHSLQAAPLTIQIPYSVTVPVSVTITGSTASATQVRETITIPAGSLSATGSVPFSPLGVNPEAISSISKAVTQYDVRLMDADGITLAILAANRRDSRYVMVELFERVRATSLAQEPTVIEVLYKKHLDDLIEDSDCLPVDGYDDAIAWKTLSNEGNDKEAIAMAEMKYQKVVSDITKSAERSIAMPMNFGRGRFVGQSLDQSWYHGISGIH